MKKLNENSSVRQTRKKATEGEKVTKSATHKLSRSPVEMGVRLTGDSEYFPPYFVKPRVQLLGCRCDHQRGERDGAESVQRLQTQLPERVGSMRVPTRPRGRRREQGEGQAA